MSLVILVEASPWSPATGAVEAVRLAGGGSRGYVHFGYHDWVAGIVGMPRFTAAIGFGQEGFTGGAIPSTAAIGVLPSDPAVIDRIAGLVWPGADILVRAGDDALADPGWTVVLAGTVAGMSIRNGAIALTVSDLAGALAKPVVDGRFGGTGGIEGGTDAKDRIKRRSWGRCFNVEGRLFDKAYNIYEFGDPAIPLAGFAAVKDRGRATDAISVVGWAGSAAATLAALRAAYAPPGGGAVAPSIAQVKWWTQPSGPLTADLYGEVGAGYLEGLGGIVARIVGARLPGGVVAPAVIDAARAGACGIHADQEGETVAQLLDRLLIPAHVAWTVSPTGAVNMLPIQFDGGGEQLQAIEAWRETVYKPVTERVLGYQRNYRLHTDAELSAVYQASDGTYADGTPIEALKPGEVGSNVTEVRTAAAIAGQGALATQNSVALGSTVRDSGGNVLSDADVRNFVDQGGLGLVGNPQGGSLGTTAPVTGAIKIVLPFGPGDAVATMLRFDVDVYDYNQRATGTFQIAGYTYYIGSTWYNCTATRIGGSGFARTVRFGRDAATGKWTVWIGELDTVWYYPQIGVKDLQLGYTGTDSAAWVRGWSVSFDQAAPTNVDFVFTNPSASDAVFGENTLESPGGVVATVAGFKTSQGTAAAIAGQGALATQSSVAYGSTYVSGFGGLAALGGVRMGGPSTGFSGIANEPGSYWITDAGYETARGNAAGFQGQSPWATFTGLAPTTVAGQVSQLNVIGQLPAESVYLSGVDYLSNRWPQEANANRTEGRVSAGFYGQGQLATEDSVAYGSSYVTGFGPLAARDRVNLGISGGVVNEANTLWITDDLAITSRGYSAGFAGQGALATQSSVAYGSAYVTGFGGLAALGGVRMGGPSGAYSGIANEPGSFWITDAGYQTAQGTAAAIAGQGPLATQSDINYDTQIGYLPAALARSALYDGNYFNADYAYYSGGVVMGSLKPGEAGANRTETRTAASIYGQGALATKGEVDWYADVADRPGWATGTITVGDVEVLQAGYVWRGGGDLRNMYDYFPRTTVADRTAAEAAAAIAGQGALATQNGVYLDSQTYGQIPDGRTLNASNNFGLRGLSQIGAIYDFVVDGYVYIAIDASTLYGDWGGSVSYPSATFGPASYGDTFYIWRNVSSPSDAGSSYGISVYLSDALGADKVYLGAITTRASAGSTGSTGGGFGGGGQGGGGGGGGGYNIP